MNDNDKLVSGFMGSISELPYGEHTLNYYEVWIGKGLHYHDSWDWLMPVVEQIEGLICMEALPTWAGQPFSVTMGSYGVQITLDNGKTTTPFTYFNGKTTKLERVYEAVIEFILWYNENK